MKSSMTLRIFIVFLIIITTFSCNENKKSGPASEVFDVSIDPDSLKSSSAEQSESDVVFYNLLSPIEMNYLFEQNKGQYNSDLLNPLSNITIYNESSKVALNLGAYGADLSYLWLFNQTQQSLSYLSAIQRLSDKLGIPRNFVDLTAKDAESHNQDFDSLMVIARQAYRITGSYLKNSNRENASTLILLGGWIETMFLITNLYDKPDSRMAGKIASQKFSLNSLINLLQNDQDDLVNSEYLLLLRKLDKAFNHFESLFNPNNLIIDSVNKRISFIEDPSINFDPEKIKEIKTLVVQIRTHMIN